MTVADNIEAVRKRVVAACERVDRDPSSVRIVAVAKGVRPDGVREAVEAGVTDIGENRAQELRDKVRALGTDGIRWHYVGGIQTNKVRYLDPVSLVHSLDRVKEGRALEKRGARRDRGWDVLVEVNVAGDPGKQGVAPERVEGMLLDLRGSARLRPRGLMIMAPRAENPEDVRWVFAEARRLRDRLRVALGDLEELSMGMSDDFELAVEEGATLVRIGRAIFGEE